MTTILARLGCSVSIPTQTLTVYDAAREIITGSLVGSVAVIEVGSGFGSEPRLIVRSDTPPTLPATIDWDDTAQTLGCHFSPAQIDMIGAGTWSVVVKIEADDDVSHDVRSMTLAIEIVRWPSV